MVLRHLSVPQLGYLLKKVMADNNSLIGSEFIVLQFTNQVIIVQVLVIIFLNINCFLIATFFKKECFYTTTRYILFAVTLLSDSTLLFISDILLILTYLEYAFEVWICIIISVLCVLLNMVTPVTLTAMTLERYVAICMPLSHAELCTTRSTLHCILIIHGISSLPCLIDLSTFFASTSLRLYKQSWVCSAEILILNDWQGHIRSAVNEFYFSIMCIIIVFSYVKIMKVAKAASGEDRKSTWKGLKTVILHAFQLLLCLIQLWTPFIESAVLQVNFTLFINVRYTNYVLFSLAPRCLSPLIYGLRDETFFHALKSSAFFGLFKKDF